MGFCMGKECVKFWALEIRRAVVNFDDFYISLESLVEFFIAFNKELADGIAEKFFLT